MNAGALRQRLRIQQRQSGLDNGGQPEESWTDVATVWAAVEPLRGREYFAAQEVNHDITHKVIMRYRVGIRPQMRGLLGDRVFIFRAVLDIEERHRELHLMCQEVVPDGT